MTSGRADALVFFGASGDSAYKQVFPALAALAGRGHLDVPVIGVAKAGWDTRQLLARAEDSEVRKLNAELAELDRLAS